MMTSHITQTCRTLWTKDRNHGRPHNLSHKRRYYLGFGPKSKTRDNEGSMRQRTKRRQFTRAVLKLFKKTFMPTRNVFHSMAHFFNVKRKKEKHWEKLVDIKRKCEFNQITPEEIITHKFAASINDKKAPDEFIEGPSELRTVLETIELDNYNRKNRDRQKTEEQKTEKSFLW